MRRRTVAGGRHRVGGSRAADHGVAQGRFIQRDRRIFLRRLQRSRSSNRLHLRHVDVHRLRGRAAMSIAERDGEAVAAVVELVGRIRDRPAVDGDRAVRRCAVAGCRHRVAGGSAAHHGVADILGEGDRAILGARLADRGVDHRRQHLVHGNRFGLRGGAAAARGGDGERVGAIEELRRHIADRAGRADRGGAMRGG